MSQDVIDINKELSEYGIKENINLEVEQNFHQLLNEISTDNTLEKFREEIEKIFIAFQHSSANEKTLIKLYKEAKEKHYKDMQKFNKLNERTLDDRKEFDNLQKRFNLLLKENQQVKEEKAKENAKSDTSPINDRAKDDYNFVDENLVENLEKEKEVLRKQLELSMNNNEKLDKEMNELLIFKDKLESQIFDIKEENITIKDSNLKLIRDVEQKIKSIDEKVTQVEILRNCKTQKEIEINDLKSGIEGFKKQIEDLNIKNINIKNDLDNFRLEKTNNEKAIKNLRNEIGSTRDENDKLRSREKEATGNLKNLEKEKYRLSKEISEKLIYLDSKDREINKLNKDVSELKTELQVKENEIRQMSLEIEKSRKETNEEIKLKNEIMFDKKKKEKEIKRGEELKNQLSDENRELENDAKSKSDKLIKLKEELEIANKINAELEKTRDKITEENTKIKNKMDHLIEDIRLRENRIQELQKKVAENDKKMKMQREVYDAVRRDKNLYFKNLIDVQDDLIDKQNLINFNKKEIEQLKSDLKKKDENIVTLKSDLSTKSDELKTKELELDRNKNEVNNLKQRVGALEKDNERLKFTVDETAKDYKKLREEYRKTVIDRDNLSSQLIRRNDEVSLLHEKIMILSSKLSRFEQDFQKKKEKINFYIRENRNLIRELEISKNYKDEANKYAKEIINLDKELLREKNLNKALTEEVESSEKLFHRWRKLEGIDPDALEMHYKINLLQKRLISKTEECVEKEITIQDLTKELANCKKLANKRPTYEIEESIKLYKQELQKITEKMKAIIAERNLFENKAEDEKTENNKIRKENTELQMKLHEQKLRNNKKNSEAILKNKN